MLELDPGSIVYGPLPEILCPVDAVSIGPGSGSDVQSAVDAHPEGTTFCLHAGTYAVTDPITPKTGDRFIGLYGAVLDGAGLISTDANSGIFRAHNQDIDNVTIRNLVIRNSPHAGIHAFSDHADGWVIARNEIYGNRIGIVHGNDFRIRANTIHDNWQYGIAGFRSSRSVIRDNEFAFNAVRSEEFPGDSATSKWAMVTDTSVRQNYVHDNFSHGLWFDGGHSGIVIADNVLVNNAGSAIFTEVGGETVIRGNTVSGSHRGIYISESHDTDVFGNTVSRSDLGIALFQDGNRLWESQLRNNFIHENVIEVASVSIVDGVEPLAVTITCLNMSISECSLYSTARGNWFDSNHYVVASVSGRWWLWDNDLRTWDDWRALGQDPTGTVATG